MIWPIRTHPAPIFTILLLQFGTSTTAQPASHIGEPLAQVMIEAGCTLTEAEAGEGLQRRGYGFGDLQAQVTALLNGRYLGSTSDGKWKLQNWPPCNQPLSLRRYLAGTVFLLSSTSRKLVVEALYFQ